MIPRDKRLRSMPCLCGDDIVAVCDDDGIMLAVRLHRLEPRHAAWAVQAGYGAPVPMWDAEWAARNVGLTLREGRPMRAR